MYAPELRGQPPTVHSGAISKTRGQLNWPLFPFAFEGHSLLYFDQTTMHSQHPYHHLSRPESDRLRLLVRMFPKLILFSLGPGGLKLASHTDRSLPPPAYRTCNPQPSNWLTASWPGWRPPTLVTALQMSFWGILKLYFSPYLSMTHLMAQSFARCAGANV